MPQGETRRFVSPQGEIWDVPAEYSDQAIAMGGKEIGPSYSERLGEGAQSGVSLGRDILEALGSSLGGVALGTSKLLGRVPAQTTLEDIGLEPRGPLQGAIKTGADIGQFLLPQRGVLTGTQILSKLPYLARFARPAMEAASAAGIAAAQTGEAEKGLLSGAIAGSVGGLGTLLSGPLKRLGASLEFRLVKPIMEQTHEGFNADTLLKYGLGGTLRQTAEKTEKLLGELGAKVENMARSSGTQVDVAQALADAEHELIGTPSSQARNFAFLKAIRNRAAEWMDTLGEIAPSGKLDVAPALDLKRSIGKLGSWLYGAHDPESNAAERLANTFYTKLRVATEGALPDGAQAIHKQMSELIPIEHAVIRRIPIVERQNPIPLETAISALPGLMGNPGLLWLPLASKALRSGRLANLVYRAGEAAPSVMPSLGRLGAAAIPGKGPPE